MTNLAQIRAEYARLAEIIILKGKEYDRREEYLREQHRLGKLTGDIYTIMRSDLLLADIGGASKTCAILAGGLAQVLMAELMYERRFASAEHNVNANPMVRSWSKHL